VVSDLSETGCFNRVVALTNGRVDGIDRNESDAEIFIEVLVGGNVSAAAFQAHLHVELATLADRRDVYVFVENLDIAVGFDHAAGDDAGLIRAQVDGFGRVTREFERNLLQVEDDVGRVLDDAGDGLEFVQHAFHLHSGDGRAFD